MLRAFCHSAVIAVTSSALCISTAPAEPPDYRGYVLPLNSESDEVDYIRLISEIKLAGANSICFLLPYQQENTTANTLAPDPLKAPSETELKQALLFAEEQSLSTMLLPIVLLKNPGEDEWRGALEPENTETWFENYEVEILKLAELAEKTQVELLSIGSEFTSLQDEERHWRELTEKVRSVYRGKILYTANWDTIDLVPWWEAVDYIGISGYYELGDYNENQLTVDKMTREWELWKNWIYEKRNVTGSDNPIIFSELGYPSIDGGAAIPWDYTQETSVDLEEQRKGFEAFSRVWDGEEELAGVFIYSWVEFSETPERGYTVRNKPSSTFIKSWFESILPTN